jgi:cytochrome c5
MKKSTRREGLPGVFRARKCRVMSLFLALSLVFVFLPVSAKEGARTGKDVVDAICADCHAIGLDGAPKIGDPDAWSSRASQGLSSLTLHALEGIRKMPAHGGHPELTDLEITRAVTYMVNQSGGNWVEPVSAAELTVERSGEEVVKAQCVKCHGEGVNGAPKIGDTNAWVQRIKQGLPNLLSAAIQGHGGMPPRGGEDNLTDNELRAAILYMYNPAGEAGKTVSGAAMPQAQRSGEEVVKAQCVKCHGEGVGGAPKIGDTNAWVQRLKQGLPQLVHSAIRGHGGMPPRGGQANLTDDELKAAILYMYNPGQ